GVLAADQAGRVERLNLRRKADPAVARRQPEDRDRGVQIHTGRKRKAERASERNEVHASGYLDCLHNMTTVRPRSSVSEHADSRAPGGVGRIREAAPPAAV